MSSRTSEGSDYDDQIEDCIQRLSDWQTDWDVTIFDWSYVRPTFHIRRKKRAKTSFPELGCRLNVGLDGCGWLAVSMALWECNRGFLWYGFLKIISEVYFL